MFSRHEFKPISRQILLVAGLALTAALFITPSVEAKDGRSALQNFKAKDLNGKKVELAKLKGKVVLINFWATWCAPCLQEMPHLDKMYKKYKKKGFVVLSVATDGPETASRIKSVVKRKRWSMPIVHDKSGAIVAQLNPRATNPFTVFIDKKGQLAHSHEGYSSGDEKGYEKLVKKLLAE